MCDIVSAVMAGSSLLGAMGNRKQGQANAAQAKIEAKVARENAALVGLQIKDAMFRGKNNLRDVRRQGAEITGRQRVAAGANNLDLSFGSPLDMIYNTAQLMGEDLETTERNTASEVADLTQRQKNYLSGAQGQDKAAKNYVKAGNLAAFGSLLSGGAQIGQYRADIA